MKIKILLFCYLIASSFYLVFATGTKDLKKKEKTSAPAPVATSASKERIIIFQGDSYVIEKALKRGGSKLPYLVRKGVKNLLSLLYHFQKKGLREPDYLMKLGAK